MRRPISKADADRALLKERVAEAVRSPVMKAFYVDTAGQTRDLSNAADPESERRFSELGALPPPYDPSTLLDVYEVSNSLRSNVEAYMVNIDGNGHHFDPVLEMEADDVRDRVRDALVLERLAARERGVPVPDLQPTDAEVEERLSELEGKIRLEQFRLEAFFESCSVEQSFPALRKKTRQDLEVAGNGFWEVLRDRRGRECQFVYLPTQTMRLLRIDDALQTVALPVRTAPLAWGSEKYRRRFRRFVQIVETRTVYFKEYGDPRTLSAKTGRFFKDVPAMQAAEGQSARAATEVVHFKIHAARSAYGIPRWIGSLLSVLGSRAAEEVNYLYFDRKGVPPLAILVSGGHVTDDSVKKIEDFINTRIKGRDNFHSVMIIEAEPASSPDGVDSGTARMKVELKPLTAAQLTDAQHQKYDERNIDKVGFAFRLPRMLRGDVRDFNRATAQAALEFAEAQVFGPERVDFDFQVNRFLLAMGFRFWRFVSNSVQIRDAQIVAEMIKNLTSVGVLVPADGRELAGQLVFNRRLAKIDADWVWQPTSLTQVGIPLDTTQDGEIPPIPGKEPAGTGAPASAGPTPPTGPKPSGVAPPGSPPASRKAWRRRDRARMSETQMAGEAAELIRFRSALIAEERRQAELTFRGDVERDAAEAAE